MPPKRHQGRVAAWTRVPRGFTGRYCGEFPAVNSAVHDSQVKGTHMTSEVAASVHAQGSVAGGRDMTTGEIQ